MLKTAPGPAKGLAPEDFRILCAWCREEMRSSSSTSSAASGPAPESHGICIPCALRLGMPPERLGIAC
jgi:hypothetical protein